MTREFSDGSSEDTIIKVLPASCAHTVARTRMTQMAITMSDELKEGCPLLEGNEANLCSLCPSDVIREDVTLDFEREGADERDDGDERGDDVCAFHRPDEVHFERDDERADAGDEQPTQPKKKA